MIELPETIVLANQINNTLVDKTITGVVVGASPHKFAWYSGGNREYREMLVGKKITSANHGSKYSCGGQVEIECEDSLLVISTPIKYHPQGENPPEKHQLLLELGDGSSLSFTVQMWGCMLCYNKDKVNFPDGFKTTKNPAPTDDAFTKSYFEKMMENEKPNLSVKALLATGQRMPGLGNGVLRYTVQCANQP